MLNPIPVLLVVILLVAACIVSPWFLVGAAALVIALGVASAV